jgi:hypothetical protein
LHKHLRKYPYIADALQYTDGKLPARVKLWRRHIKTILAGACRYADRLFAANLVPTDKCSHPSCKNARCTAEHWIYECAYNSKAISTTGKAIEEAIKITSGATYLGIARANKMRNAFSKPCLRICGICPYEDDYHVADISYQQELDDVKNLYTLAANDDEAIKDLSQIPGAYTVTVDGQMRLCGYTDGSCQFPRQPHLTHAGWGVALSENGTSRSGPVIAQIQTSYRAELRAIAEVLAIVSVLH